MTQKKTRKTLCASFPFLCSYRTLSLTYLKDFARVKKCPLSSPSYIEAKTIVFSTFAKFYSYFEVSFSFLSRCESMAAEVSDQCYLSTSQLTYTPLNLE